MKYALVIVEIPSDNSLQVENTLNNFLLTVEEKVLATAKVDRLNAGSFLLDLSDGLAGLTGLVAAAKDRGYKSRTLFFENKPQWVIS